MKYRTKPPKLTKPSAKKRIAIKVRAKDQLANLRRRLEKIDADRKAKAKPKALAKPEQKKRGRPPTPKPKSAIETKPKPKERKMVRYRKSHTGEDVAVDATAAVDEPTKVYVFHLNLVTPAVEATEDQPAIPEYVEQQAEGVRWSDRTYTMHWTAEGPAVGYVTFPSLRHLKDTYPKLTVVFVDSPDVVDPLKDDDAADLELRQKEADLAAIAAREARARAEEAKARVEARQQNHHA